MISQVKGGEWNARFSTNNCVVLIKSKIGIR